MDNPFSGSGMGGFSSLWARLAQIDPQRYGASAAFAMSPYEQAQMEIEAKRQDFQQAIALKQQELQTMSQAVEFQRQAVIDARTQAKDDRAMAQKDRELDIRDATQRSQSEIARQNAERQGRVADSTIARNNAQTSALQKKANGTYGTVTVKTPEANAQAAARSAITTMGDNLARLGTIQQINRDQNKQINDSAFAFRPDNPIGKIVTAADRVLGTNLNNTQSRTRWTQEVNRAVNASDRQDQRGLGAISDSENKSFKQNYGDTLGQTSGALADQQNANTRSWIDKVLGTARAQAANGRITPQELAYAEKVKAEFESVVRSNPGKAAQYVPDGNGGHYFIAR